MVSENLRRYIVEKHIAMRQISKATGIKEQRIYSVFRKNNPRPLRAEDFLKICRFLDADPFDFFEDEK